MKPGPPLEESSKLQGQKTRLQGSCFMSIKRKPVWAVALTEERDFTLKSFFTCLWQWSRSQVFGVKPSCDSKTHLWSPTYCGAPSVSMQG